VTTHRSEWIAAAGLRRVDIEAETTLIPEVVLADPELSLAAKGLYALLLAEQGRPVNPFDDAIESESEIAAAVDELTDAGLAVRVPQPR